MDFNMSTVLVIVVFACSVYLLMDNEERLWPLIATIVSGIWLLLSLGIMSLSLAKYRIDVILPALLVVAGIVSWLKSATKGAITAASVVSFVGAMQLFSTLHILD